MVAWTNQGKKGNRIGSLFTVHASVCCGCEASLESTLVSSAFTNVARLQQAQGRTANRRRRILEQAEKRILKTLERRWICLSSKYSIG